MAAAAGDGAGDDAHITPGWQTIVGITTAPLGSVPRMEPDPERHARLYERPSYKALVATFAANARRLRRERGWTQVQAAVRCEMALYLYQRVESGRWNVTFTTVARLCDGFRVEPEVFFKAVAPLPAPKRGRPKGM